MSNFCKTGVMSTCMEKDSGWAVQKACEFSDKASNADRCMYCVHDKTLCDNSSAQADAKNPSSDDLVVEDILDIDFDNLEMEAGCEHKIDGTCAYEAAIGNTFECNPENCPLDKYTMDDMLDDIRKSEEEDSPKPVLPDMAHILGQTGGA